MKEDPFDKTLRNLSITKQTVLNKIEEWSAICYYLSEAYGIPDFEPELRKAYTSPIRSLEFDDKPSFSIWEASNKGLCEYIWKDSGIRKSGNLFYLIALLYDYKSDEEVFRRIDTDFALGLYDDNPQAIETPILKTKPTHKEPASIRVYSKPFSKQGLEFWKSFGLTQADLEYEQIQEVQYFWTSKTQVIPFTPPSLCFAYRIGNFYKLYQPFNKEYKFIQDYPEQFVEGWLQLEYKQDLCIITKSKKDVAVLRKLGYESVSPKSESTMIQPKQMQWLKDKYKHILILFDNDGKHNGHKYQELYGLQLIFIPLSTGQKDISDYTKEFGVEKAKILMESLVEPYKGITNATR